MIIQALEISLAIVGLRLVTDKGMVLDFLRQPYLSGGTITQILLKPVVGCYLCMSSFWTLVLYPFLVGVDWKIFPTMFIVAAFNAIIYNTILRLESD